MMSRLQRFLKTGWRLLIEVVTLFLSHLLSLLYLIVKFTTLTLIASMLLVFLLIINMSFLQIVLATLFISLYIILI